MIGIAIETICIEAGFGASIDHQRVFGQSVADGIVRFGIASSGQVVRSFRRTIEGFALTIGGFGTSTEHLAGWTRFEDRGKWTHEWLINGFVVANDANMKDVADVRITERSER